ncbi:hypothetical protein AOQ84DRAFT_149132 [Glonium stellatum]|uniref:Uncharacterized protein n=1 Tax=Glonium stellatum TaxID=574774 RepID=A0A8E2ERD9_9PEZI|nr:hypothetical protein AOQ84DRAFT_149132 [Glonium stellatum]
MSSVRFKPPAILIVGTARLPVSGLNYPGRFYFCFCGGSCIHGLTSLATGFWRVVSDHLIRLHILINPRSCQIQACLHIQRKR